MRIEGEEHTYNPIVEWVDRARFPMLGHIDPYGNTIFNGGQMQTLIEELELVRALYPEASSQSADAVSEIQRLCEIGARRPHTYLWFIGD